MKGLRWSLDGSRTCAFFGFNLLERCVGNHCGPKVVFEMVPCRFLPVVHGALSHRRAALCFGGLFFVEK